MSSPLGRTTWRHLLRTHGSSFLNWLEQTNRSYREFETLSRQLTHYLERTIQSKDDALRLIERISPALDSCDGATYSEVLAAEAYAFVHFLERYRRTWRVLSHMVNINVLPMSRRGMEVLDIGIGPGSTAYAISDFYRCLRDFAVEFDIANLITPAPRYTFVELAPAMRQFVHYFSELERRRGPYHTLYADFTDLDLDQIRSDDRVHFIKRVEEEDDTSWRSAKQWVEAMYGPEADVWRFQLVMFSFFFTLSGQVASLTRQLQSAFKALTIGGVLIVIGGVGTRLTPETYGPKNYQSIYQAIAAVRNQTGIGAKKWPILFSADTENRYCDEIKRSYTRLGQHVLDLGVDGSAAYPAEWRVRVDPNQRYRPRPFAATIYRRRR